MLRVRARWLAIGCRRALAWVTPRSLCRNCVASWSSKQSIAAASCSARARSERAGPRCRPAAAALGRHQPHARPRRKFYVVLYGSVLVWADMTDKQTQLTPLELRASAAKQVRRPRPRLRPQCAATPPHLRPPLQHLDGVSMVALQDDAARAAKRKARQDILMERKEQKRKAKDRASAMWSSLSSRHSLSDKRSPSRGGSVAAGAREGEGGSHQQRPTSRADLMIRQQRQKKQRTRRVSQVEGSQAWGRVGPTGEPQGGVKVRAALHTHTNPSRCR